jgi:K+/H+ antiporter YhaU regulatory subunit KhtT
MVLHQATAPLQTGPLQIAVVETLTQAVAFSLVSLAVSAVAAVLYRWYFQTTIPPGLAALLGVAAVAIPLNTVGLLGDVIGAVGSDPFATQTVLVNVLTLLVAFAVTPIGRRIGDSIGRDTTVVSGAKELDAEVGRFVRTVGRVTAVELPAEADIEDMETYDPVASEVKARFAGKTLVFPNRLTVPELRDRLVTRLKEDYEVGYVDVELDVDGTVQYLAVGSRVAGIGPTLGPGTCAIAVEADPAHTASPGDVVQVWTDGEDPERITTAELRATAGDVVTLAADEADVAGLDADRAYRLVTLPTTPRADREFTSLLRAADETLGSAHLTEESSLVGKTVVDVDATVVAIRGADGSLDTLPRRTRELAAGDDVYVVGRPETLRRLEQQASGGAEAASVKNGETGE